MHNKHIHSWQAQTHFCKGFRREAGECYIGRVCRERMGGGESSVSWACVFKRENMHVNSDYACVSTFFPWWFEIKSDL